MNQHAMRKYFCLNSVTPLVMSEEISSEPKTDYMWQQVHCHGVCLTPYKSHMKAYFVGSSGNLYTCVLVLPTSLKVHGL
jgi:hypothetical protein